MYHANLSGYGVNGHPRLEKRQVLAFKLVTTQALELVHVYV